MTGWYTWEACPFLKRKEEEWVGLNVVGRDYKGRKEGGETVFRLEKIN